MGRDFTGFEGLATSGLDAIFDNLMNGLCTITSHAGWKWSDVTHDLGMRLCDLAHQDFIVVCDGVRVIIAAHQTQRLALVPTLESATPIENELDRLDILYGFGVRSMGVVYSEANALGSGLRQAGDAGLTDFGCEAVRRMNKLGILIDAALCGDQTTLDIIEESKLPIVISHAGARALWHTTLTEQHPRHSCLLTRYLAVSRLKRSSTLTD